MNGRGHGRISKIDLPMTMVSLLTIIRLDSLVVIVLDSVNFYRDISRFTLVL